MNDGLLPAEDRLIAGLDTAVRGPRRNGLFALWLVVRVCDGLLPSDTLSDRAHHGRLDGLQRRLSSLSLQPPLRRALSGCLSGLRDGTPDAAAVALQQLVAPAGETLGTDAGEAITWAARSAKAMLRELRSSQRRR